MKIPVVYDTMLFLQAASRPWRVHASFRAIAEGRVVLCLSRNLITEIAEVLNRSELREKYPALSPVAVEEFIAEHLARGRFIENVPGVFTWPDHPYDDHLFNLAIAAQARYLVTWETRIVGLLSTKAPAADLLRSLAPQLEIITPKALSQELRKNAGRESE